MTSEGTIITVFGSSRPRAGESDYEEARQLGCELAKRGFQICSGGYGGVMEAVSRGAKEAGGRTIAVTSTFFRTKANAWVDEEHAASTWQERLFELVRFGEGYVACKGGTGTLVELRNSNCSWNQRTFFSPIFTAIGILRARAFYRATTSPDCRCQRLFPAAGCRGNHGTNFFPGLVSSLYLSSGQERSFITKVRDTSLTK